MTDFDDPLAARLARLGVAIMAADPERMALLAAQLDTDAAHLRRPRPISTEPLAGPLSGRPTEPGA